MFTEFRSLTCWFEISFVNAIYRKPRVSNLDLEQYCLVRDEFFSLTFAMKVSSAIP